MLFIGCSIIILPFFIVVGLVKIGNYSNDGRKVGIFDIRRYSKYLVTDAEQCEQSADQDKRWLSILWKHSLPTGPLLHLLISLCFLIPRVITEAQLIRHGFLSKGKVDSVCCEFDQLTSTCLFVQRTSGRVTWTCS